MKNEIQKSSKLYKNLSLTGMMGVGKSTIGKNLAKRLEYNFIDIDKLIETREKTSINIIFKNKEIRDINSAHGNYLLAKYERKKKNYWT